MKKKRATSQKTESKPRSASRQTTTPELSHPRWTFLTNHSHVLILLSQNPAMILRDVSQRVGITERAVQRIIAELEESGALERERVGRQNHYHINTKLPLRHSIEAHRTIGDLLQLIVPE